MVIPYSAWPTWLQVLILGPNALLASVNGQEEDAKVPSRLALPTPLGSVLGLENNWASETLNPVGDEFQVRLGLAIPAPVNSPIESM